jgi:hypothetical protein
MRLRSLYFDIRNRYFRGSSRATADVPFARDRNLFVHHHLGLGDMIHCNGMVRGLLEELSGQCNLHLICKRRNAIMVQWMYRDEPRIVLESIDETKNEQGEVRRVLRERQSDNFLSVGHKALRRFEKDFPNLFFDQLFYLQLNMPYERRFTKCHWEREIAEEERVFRKLAPQGPYAFVHDDAARGYVVDTRSLDLPIVRNDTSESIFHLGLLLERAAEIHCMESSIRCMMESLQFQHDRLYYHSFRYPDRPLGNATRLPWREVGDRKAA